MENQWIKKIFCLFILLCVAQAFAIAADGSLSGSGTAGDPYLVTDYADLKVVGTSYSLGAVYLLVADIDASVSSTENSNSGFIPIGTSTTPFTGKFHGQGHRVINLHINRSTTDNIGLFGFAAGSTIDSLGLIDNIISGKSNVGGIVGSDSSCSISFCYNTGSVTSTSSNVGGIAGYNYFNSTISDCYNTGSIAGNAPSYAYAGGIVGYNNSSSTISYCYNTGYVSGAAYYVGGITGYNSTNSIITNCNNTGRVAGYYYYVGGIAGYNNTTSTISNSYNIGTVTGNTGVGGIAGNNNGGSIISNCYNTSNIAGYYVGGISGTNSGGITNSYNTGNVTAASSLYAGGLVGANYSGSTLSYCYTTGLVSGSSYTGILAGYNQAGASISYCYWDAQTSGPKSTSGGGSGTLNTVNGLATAQMKNSSNLTNLNFTSIWKIRNDSTYAGLQSVGNNAPFAFADTLSSNRKFFFSKLLLNDFDIETAHNNLSLKIISVSRGATDGTNTLMFADSISNGTVSTINYRIGEIRTADTLWGNTTVGVVTLDTTSDRPSIVSFAPLRNALNIDANVNISVTFSGDVDSTTLTSSTIRVNGSLSGLHQSTWNYNSVTNTLTIDPNTDFKTGELITVTITCGIKSKTLGLLANPQNWSFSIKTPVISSGSFKQTSTPGAGSYPYAIAPGDFDADGDIDLAITNSNSNAMTVMLNNGSGIFVLDSTYSVGSSPVSICARDLDGDGDIDLAVSDYGSNAVSILLNNGSGTFAQSSVPAVGTHPQGVAPGDFDSDGDLDLAVVNNVGNTISILMNNGSGSFTQTSTPAVGSDSRAIVAGDFDGDGDIDLAVGNLGNSTISILLNNGSGTFTPTSAPAVGNNPFSITTGDFDADGDIDLATANRYGNTVTILTNNGSGTFTVSSSPAVGNYPWSISAGDFDGDGDIDLAIANGTANTISILLNNASGTFIQSSTPGVGSNPYSVASADLDGDGDIDLISTQRDDGVLTILKNIPAAPAGLMVTDSSSHTVSIAWNKNIETNFSRYRIYMDTIANPSILVDSTMGGIGDTSKTLNGLTNSVRYYLRVTAVDNTDNESSYSNEVNVVPADRIPPAVPQNLAVTDSSSQTITITWTKNTDSDFMRYRIYMGTNPNPVAKVDSLNNIADTVKTFSGLSNTTRYYIRVSAVDSVENESGYSNEVSAVPADRIAPAAPQNLVVTDSSHQSITIKWERSTDSDFALYRIYCGTNSNPVTALDSTSGGSLDTSKIISGLNVGTRYYFSVTAVDSAGNESGYSNDASAVPHTTVTFEDGSSYSAPSAWIGCQNNPIGRFKLIAGNAGSTLSSVNVHFVGTFSGIEVVKLWSSPDSIFGGDAQLDSVLYSGFSVVLNGNNSPIDSAGTYYFVSVDLGTSEGNIAVKIQDNSSFTFKAGILDGTITDAPLSGNSSTITGISDKGQIVPRVFALHQNYPNPFNPSTTISFTLAKDGPVTLMVYDMLGREVGILVNGQKKAGIVHQVTFDASRLSSGMYLYRLQSENTVLVKKLMLIK